MTRLNEIVAKLSLAWCSSNYAVPIAISDYDNNDVRSDLTLAVANIAFAESFTPYLTEKLGEDNFNIRFVQLPKQDISAKISEFSDAKSASYVSSNRIRSYSEYKSGSKLATSELANNDPHPPKDSTDLTPYEECIQSIELFQLSPLEAVIRSTRLNKRDKLSFKSQYEQKSKNINTGVVLSVFLGGVGAHFYWLGNMPRAIIYTVFCWTYIPAVLGFIDAFRMANLVNTYNARIAKQILVDMELMNML